MKKLVKMDGAFPYMDDLSEKEISDRLESLFDSSLPSVSFTDFYFYFFGKVSAEIEK